MTAATAAFFEGLRQQRHVPALERLTGRVRFDLADPDRTDRWLVSVDRGDVAVSRRGGRADCVVSADKDVFEGMATGRVNAMSAVLRGLLGVEGDLNMLVLFQRVFPGPARRGAPTEAIEGRLS